MFFATKKLRNKVFIVFFATKTLSRKVFFIKKGLKLKLLNVLHLGRHVVVNSKMLAGTNLQAACVVADTVEEQIQKINSMLSVEFTSKDCEKRIAQLSNFNNHTNLQKLIKLL